MFVSCQKDIDLEYNDFESSLVLNAIFSTNENWSINLSNTRNILDENSEIMGIDDASVVVTNVDSSRNIILLGNGDGVYSASEKPEPGHEYTIRVTKGGFKNISSHSYVPEESSLSLIEISSLDTSMIEVDGKKALQVNFSIEDIGQENNFYIWDLIVEDPNNLDSAVDKFLPHQQAHLSSWDGNLDPLTEQSEFQSKLFITDSDFNGQSYSTSFLSYDERIQNGYSNAGTITKAQLKLRILSVSEELYNYFKSVEAYHRSQSVNTSVVNPVEIRSNVENGLGIFGSYSEKIFNL